MATLKREGQILLVSFTIWSYFTFPAVNCLQHIGPKEGLDKSNKISIRREVAELNHYFPTTGSDMVKMGDYDPPGANPHPKVYPPPVPSHTHFSTFTENTLVDGEHPATEYGPVHDLLESNGPDLIIDYDQSGANHGGMNHDYPPPHD